MQLLSNSKKRVGTDGLNSLRYETKAFEELPLYTRILAHIDENTVMVSRFLFISGVRGVRRGGEARRSCRHNGCMIVHNNNISVRRGHHGC